MRLVADLGITGRRRAGVADAFTVLYELSLRRPVRGLLTEQAVHR